MKFRTDLADENEKFSESFLSQTKRFGEIEIKKIHFDSADNFIFYFDPNLLSFCAKDFKKACIYALSSLAPKRFSKVLVCGLGNPDITSDSFGPKTAEKILVTAHMKKESAANNIREISSFSPDVAGKTGIESFDLIKSALSHTNAELLIAIDSICTSDPKKLCSALQFSSGGITAGSGLKKHKTKLCKETLNVPVIAVGMPTVIDMGQFAENGIDLSVTPLDIDILIKNPAKNLSSAINAFLTGGLFTSALE